MITRVNSFAFAATLIATAASAQTATPTDAQQRAARAGETLTLTLDDAVQRAVGHNPDLAVVRLGTEIEAANVGEARTAYTPVFSTMFGRSTNVLPPINSLLGDRSVDTKDWFSSTGVRQRVPWGSGTWSISWDASRTTSNSPLNSFDPSLQSGVQVAFSQPLLKDRTIDAARQQIVIAKRNEQTSELAFRESAAQTVARVKLAYWTLKAQRANVSVQQRSLDLAQELAKQNEVRVRVGQSPPIDLVQVQAEVADRREALIRATTAAEDAEDRLRRVIMDPNDTSFWNVRLDPVDDPPDHLPQPDLEAIVAKALNQRYDLGRARNSVENAATNVRFFSNQKLPDVRLEASYRTNGLGGSQLLRAGGFPGTVTGRLNSGFGDVLGQLVGTDYPTWSVGVTVSYPLGHSYESMSGVRAEVEQRQAAQRVASLELDVANEIRQAARQVRSTSEREEAARAAETLAEQRLEAEQRRFEVGLSTTFLVTQAQRDLLQAQVNVLQGSLDYQASLVNFEALQLAPAQSAYGAALGSSNVVVIPTSSPRGIFRPATGSALEQ